MIEIFVLQWKSAAVVFDTLELFPVPFEILITANEIESNFDKYRKKTIKKGFEAQYVTYGPAKLVIKGIS